MPKKTISKYKILLVEDATAAQTMASLILMDMGCEVHVVATGKEAAEQVKQENFDMAFMDLGLPDIDGFSTTEAIRKHEMKERKKHLPIIALTAHEGDHIEVTCLDAKMDDFLVKPLTEEKVKQMFRKYIK